MVPAETTEPEGSPDEWPPGLLHQGMCLDYDEALVSAVAGRVHGFKHTSAGAHGEDRKSVV